MTLERFTPNTGDNPTTILAKTIIGSPIRTLEGMVQLEADLARHLIRLMRKTA